MTTNYTTAYFFGVKPGKTSGHFCYVPGYHSYRRESDPKTPWTLPEIAWMTPVAENVMDECWDKRDGQPEGEPRFTRKGGWIAVTLWDRSADRRGGCCAIFAFEVECNDAEALGLARQLFPGVFERIEKHLGREVRLPPACCPTCRRAFD